MERGSWAVGQLAEEGFKPTGDCIRELHEAASLLGYLAHTFGGHG